MGCHEELGDIVGIRDAGLVGYDVIDDVKSNLASIGITEMGNDRGVVLQLKQYENIVVDRKWNVEKALKRFNTLLVRVVDPKRKIRKKTFHTSKETESRTHLS